MNRRLEELERRARNLQHGQDVPFLTSEIGDPQRSGYQKGWGLPVWAKHYRKTLGRDNAMHIKIIGARGLIHREHVNPKDDPLGHLIQDMKPKHWLEAALTGAGAVGAVTFLAKRKK